MPFIKTTIQQSTFLFFLLLPTLLFSQGLKEPIQVESGLLSGAVIKEPGKKTVQVYKGIPFARPPVGNLRWKPPQPLPAWKGVKKATAFGNICPQPKPILGKKVGTQDEDCLYLNIWTAAKSAKEKLPVMVWIHGGGLTTGSGRQSLYDGTRLARKGVILVTINYRLDPFGFFAHPWLSAESPKSFRQLWTLGSGSRP
jgi:para-nitrobenzyl esterase